jgi:hypothetical protein
MVRKAGTRRNRSSSWSVEYETSCPAVLRDRLTTLFNLGMQQMRRRDTRAPAADFCC